MSLYRRWMLRRLMQHPLVKQGRELLGEFERVLRSRSQSTAAKPAPQPLRIDGATTSWVFVSDSDEPRHLWDIVLGAHVLNLKKVPRAHVHVCTNHIAAAQHLNPYGIRNIKPIDQLDAVLGGLHCELLVLVVEGHGTFDGAGQAKRVLSPADAITKVRGVAGLRAAVIVLNQCFAGVFNLLDAAASPPLVLIGATNLNESISTKIDLQKPLPQEDGSPGIQSWLANIFSLSFFAWIESQPDVDGDGALTILDAFKFAGAVSNQQLIKAKGELFVTALTLVDQLRALGQAPPAQNPQQAGAHMLQVRATEKQLSEALKMLYLHQEPWILHANLARKILVSLPAT